MKKMIPIFIIVLLIGIALFNQWDKKQKLKDAATKTNETSEAKNTTVGLEPNQTAPNFVLKNMQEEVVQLSDYKGKKVMVNFWATWCPPCRVEIPELNTFYKNKNENEEILAVNLTTEEKSPSAIEEFVQEYEMEFPILLDENGNVGKMYTAFTIPTSYFIDSNGKVYYKHVGPLTESQVRDIFDEMK